jgi:hypothetical protein
MSAWLCVCARAYLLPLCVYPPPRARASSASSLSSIASIQIDGIFARADADGSTEIDFEEFMVSISKTLPQR